MRLTWLEGRMDRVEHELRTGAMGSRHEPPRSIGSLIKEWQPLIVSLVILAGVLMGKLSWPEALGLLKGGP